jgi:hypothetical protein
MFTLNSIKDSLWKYPIVKRIASRSHNFFCIVTPVFDPAYDSICKLVMELQLQSYGRFIHVLVSNGPSLKIKNYISELHETDPRFIYVEIPEETTSTPEELFFNVCKRRDFCLKTYNAERYIFLDADAKIVDNGYFLKLYHAHRTIKRDILLTLVKMRVQNNEIILPIFPIKLGQIDIANYSFSKKIARMFNYPTDHDPGMGGYGNDYRFFKMISNENNTALLNFVSVAMDGNNSYKRLTELLYPTRFATH